MSIPLEPTRDEMSELTSQITNFLDHWYQSIPEMPAHGDDPTLQSLDELMEPPSESGRDLEEILNTVTQASEGGIYHPSGGHLSYIPNAGLYTAALADFLATALNRYTGVATAAPGFTAMEHGIVDWLTSLFELGEDASGLLLSGGSMANFTGVVTARVARLGDDFTNGVIYVTGHTHHSSAKAARLAGFRDDQIVDIPVDDNLRMDVRSLQDRARHDRGEGRVPFLVIGSAGTTDTGTVDPLQDIAEVAGEEGLWLHVDGAYGGFFQLTSRGRERLTGIERADSIALDPHKGLSIPFGVGALLTRSEDALRAAHQGRGAYLRDEDTYLGLRDIASLGPELSRPFRAMSVWLPLQLHGISPFRDALDRSLDIASYGYERAQTMQGVDARWEPDLSIVAFGFDDNEAGRAAWEAVNADGQVHLSPTIIDGRFILRLAVLNRRTTTDHIDHALDIVEKALIG